MTTAVKILVVGDANGKIDAALNRAEKVHSKSGPFDLLICAGEFFGTTNDDLTPYKTGAKTVSLPTYILGSSHPEGQKICDSVENGEICPNLIYLGKRGLYSLSSGLKIAYISGSENGTDDKSRITKDDVISVRNQCIVSKGSMSDYRGVDILISSEWPMGIRDGYGSKLISYLCKTIKPRYMICGKTETKEETLYRFPADKETGYELSMRFIALAAINNPKKEKQIMAFNLTPVEKMRFQDLLQKQINEEPAPFDHIDYTGIEGRSASTKSGGDAQYFYDMDDRRRKGGPATGGHDDKKRKIQVIEQEKCWFCLSSENVEKHLVLSIGRKFYLALAKGPINDLHILILSIMHIPNCASLPEEDWKELNEIKDKLRRFYRTLGMAVCFTERNYRSSHLMVNVIAIDDNLEWKIKHSFDDKSEEYNIPFDTIEPITGGGILPEQGPYFFAELPDNTALITRKMKHFPIHLAREIFCNENLLNCDEKTDWKDCKLTREQEEDIVSSFKRKYDAFDLKN